VALFDSMGNAWTADYLKVTGDLAVDLRNDIASEARAKIVYERLIAFTQDEGTKRALQFLMTSEITHMRAFSAALERTEKPPFSIGVIQPTPGLVDEYFNASTGEGPEGEKDVAGPWNKGNGLHVVESGVDGGEGLNTQPYDAEPGAEVTSPADSTPVGAYTNQTKHKGEAKQKLASTGKKAAKHFKAS
jgi:Mn-containing catalase